MTTEAKLIDLHTHSIFSDGTLSPQQLVQHAAQKRLHAIALTDHDTIDGLPYAQAEGKLLGIKVINGVEITVTFRDGNFAKKELHILGLGFIENDEITATFKMLAEYRKKRNKTLVNLLNDRGINITYEELENTAANNITKAHFVKLIVDKGYGEDFYKVFNKYFTGNVPTNIPKESLSPTEAISIIHNSGGIAVLAHPLRYGFSNNQVTELCHRLKDCGIDALEALYTTHSQGDEQFIRSIAKDLDLKITGGSDFHGDTKPGVQLGTGMGNLKIPIDILENLNI